MPTPADLVSHYSTKAFQTRLAALATVGAVLGAEIVWNPQVVDGGVLGNALLLVVGSLAEMNRRYTHSYLCACRAAARKGDEQQMWRAFTAMNEALWTPFTKLDGAVVLQRKGSRLLSRFLLSWGTYLPGVAAGLYLALAHARVFPVVTIHEAEALVALLLATALLSWWFVLTRWTHDPERLLETSGKGAAGR